MEREEQIMTQEIDLFKAAKVPETFLNTIISGYFQTIEKNQTQTLENVLMKTNSKLGGMSHVVDREPG